MQLMDNNKAAQNALSNRMLQLVSGRVRLNSAKLKNKRLTTALFIETTVNLDRLPAENIKRLGQAAFVFIAQK